MKREKDIERILRDGRQIDKALAKAARKAIEDHKRAGLPLVVWREGRIALVPPEELERGNGKRAQRSRRRRKS